MFKKNRPHLLIIGGTGFIGYHLALKAIKKKWIVTSISLNKPKKHKYINGVNYIKTDISNLKKTKKKLVGSFTHVVNLGGYVKHFLFKGKTDAIIKTHFLGLINLIKILPKKKIKKFVQIGSSAEYGDAKSPQKEDVHGQPNSSYGIAKLASTRLLLSLYNTKKFPVTILRFFQIYGPKQDKNRVLPQIISGCLKNIKFPASKGQQIRDFCYIDDAVNAIFLALLSKKSVGEVFNIGSGQPLKLKKIITEIQKKIGKGTVQFGKVKYRKDENMKLYPNINKAKKQLKWQPKVRFNRGIDITIDSYKNYEE